MKKIIIASASRGAGKTFVTVGLMKALGKRAGYMKPLGNRLLYSRKSLKDYDAALIAEAFGLKTPPEELTIGFEHAKIRHTYDRWTIKEKVLEMCEREGRGKSVLLIESGSDMRHGISVNLDAASLAKYVDGKIILVVNGDSYDAIDDALFFADYIMKSGAEFAGVIINNVKEPQDFKDMHLSDLKKAKIKVLGVIPYAEELTYYTAGYLAENIFSRKLTGERGLDRLVKNVFVGDMSATCAGKEPAFRREGKLVITSGDRSDMILAAIDSNASCVVLTNNIMPHPTIVSKASHACIPLLLVPTDTYSTATKIEHMEQLLTKGDTGKIELLGRMVKKHVRLTELTGK